VTGAGPAAERGSPQILIPGGEASLIAVSSAGMVIIRF
jgi:hypothetical protein